jgi:hypothetical protein
MPGGTIQNLVSRTRLLLSPFTSVMTIIKWIFACLAFLNDNLASEVQAKIAVQAAQRQYWSTKTLPAPEQLGLFLK